MAGQGPLNTLATLKDYVQPLKPKFVLWFFYEGNDVSDLLYEQQSPLLIRYLDGNFSQTLGGRQAEIDRALETYIESEKAAARRFSERPSKMTETVGRARRFLEIIDEAQPLASKTRAGLWRLCSIQPVDEPRFKTTMDLFDRALREAKSTVDSWGGKLYFVYLPERDSCFDSGRTGADRAQVLAMVRTVGIPLIDLHHAFRSQSDPLALFPFRRLGHYNQKGHRLVGDEVLKSISLIGN